MRALLQRVKTGKVTVDGQTVAEIAHGLVILLGVGQADTEQQAKATRDPVAPAKRSRSALAKASRHTLDDGTPVHSFATLLGELSTIVRNTCRTPGAGADAPTFNIVTTPNAKQKRAFELLQQISV